MRRGISLILGGVNLICLYHTFRAVLIRFALFNLAEEEEEK